jgi:hypothetical protein
MSEKGCIREFCLLPDLQVLKNKLFLAPAQFNFGSQTLKQHSCLDLQQVPVLDISSLGFSIMIFDRLCLSDLYFIILA